MLQHIDRDIDIGITTLWNNAQTPNPIYMYSAEQVELIQFFFFLFVSVGTR